MTNEAHIPKQPFMPAACADHLRDCLLSSRSYLEYGSGGSTMLALSLGVPVIQSIESDAPWLERLKATAQSAYPGYAGLYTGTWIDLGATGNWGYPVNHDQHAVYWKYPLAPWTSDRVSMPPDLVLIDGRFRVACLLATVLYAPAGTTVLFDDYGDRPHYHEVEDFIQPVMMVDRMAVFKAPGMTAAPRQLLELLLPALQDTR